MSIPKQDPAFTVAQLREVGERLHNVAYEYWEACHKAGIPSGAVQWITYQDGSMVIFTRGEYKSQLMANIDRQGSSFSFGTGDLDE